MILFVVLVTIAILCAWLFVVVAKHAARETAEMGNGLLSFLVQVYVGARDGSPILQVGFVFFGVIALLFVLGLAGVI